MLYNKFLVGFLVLSGWQISFAHDDILDNDQAFNNRLSFTTSYSDYQTHLTWWDSFTTQTEKDVTMQDMNLGLIYTGVYNFKQFFIGGELSGAINTNVKHINSKKMTNWYGDCRGLFGLKVTLNERTSLDPYLGLGYYYSVDNTQDSVSYGLRSVQEKLYMPIGINYSFELNEYSKLIANIEYDMVVTGSYIVNFSEENNKLFGLEKPQYIFSSYGIRSNLVYQRHHWSIGPYLIYWHNNNALEQLMNIIVLNLWCSSYRVNNWEMGLKISYHF